MKVVVIGGTGLIGSKVVVDLQGAGHDAVAASPDSGVNTLTGDGLADVLEGAAVVIDVSNSPSFEDAAVLHFFETSTRHILDTSANVGVGHLVVLSVVGSERMPGSGYMRAKIAQERLVKASSLPFSIVHTTQFFEFLPRIANDATDRDTVRVPAALIQPMAAADVASAVSTIALGAPVNGTIEVAGPEQFRFEDIVRQDLAARGDPRTVVADAHARYFGTELDEHSLVPGDDAQLSATRYEDWFARSAASPR